MSIQTFIEEADVSLATLEVELERASIAYRDEKQGLYVTEQGFFPFWVRLYEEDKFILLNSYVEFLPGVEKQKMLEISNDINGKLMIPSTSIISVNEDTEEPEIYRLRTDYALYYREGLIGSHFVRLCRAFSDGMCRIQNGVNKEQKYLRPVVGERLL